MIPLLQNQMSHFPMASVNQYLSTVKRRTLFTAMVLQVMLHEYQVCHLMMTSGYLNDGLLQFPLC